MKKILLLPLSVCFILSLTAQDFNKEKLDSLFTLIDQNDRGMGSVSVFQGDKEVYQRTIGFVDVDKKLKADGNTEYRIGSISKTFTACIIIQMIEEEKLSYFTRLGNFYPGIPNAGEITIEMLLRHRSGLFNFTNAEDYPSWMEKPKSEEELLETIKNNGTVFEPDAKAEYSNTNYVLLSYIAQKIDEKPFSEILQDRIVKPLALGHTYMGGKIDPTKNQAQSYTWKEKWKLSTESDMGIPIGAGAIVSTPTDLNAFYHALFNNKIVSEESVKKMMTLVDNYGMGLFRYPFYNEWAYGHTGGIDGFQSHAVYLPQRDVTITYVGNGVAMARNDILLGVLKIYFGMPYELPAFIDAIEIKSKELDQYLGVYGSATFPLKITITKEGKQLMGQATGQPAFPLEAYEAHKFRFEAASLKIEFVPEENKLILRQGGGEFHLARE